jgi:hypothetical protein
MTRRSIVSGVAVAAGMRGPTAEPPSIGNRLIGVWNLLTIQVTIEGKILHPYSGHPVGRLTYDTAGRTSAHVMKPGRRSSVTDPSTVSTATEDQVRQIADGYVGYYGSFSVEGDTVTHHIEACTLPAWTGTDQKRQCEFVGDQLVLPFGPNKLVWERLSD